MKKTYAVLLITAFAIMQSCNNNASTDSVAEADSLNSAKDTTATSITSTESSSNMGVNGDVADFAVKAVNGNLMEIEMGKYASTHASDQSVKQFAQTAVKIHSGFDKELKSLSMSKNISLPDSTGNRNLDKIEDIMKKTGKDFDKAYMNRVVSDHKNDVSLFENAASDLKDSAFKAFASNTLATIKKHLSDAEAIMKAKNY